MPAEEGGSTTGAGASESELSRRRRQSAASTGTEEYISPLKAANSKKKNKLPGLSEASM